MPQDLSQFVVPGPGSINDFILYWLSGTFQYRMFLLVYVVLCSSDVTFMTELSLEKSQL